MEKAEESSPAEQLEWLWQLLGEMCRRQPKLRVIVGSRTDVANEFARSWRRHVPLDAFSREDADRFLQEWSQGQMPEDVRQAVFALTLGHPLLMEMAAEVWRDGLEAN